MKACFLITGLNTIFPLFKKGTMNDPKNYRGISSYDIRSKLYSSIINVLAYPKYSDVYDGLPIFFPFFLYSALSSGV